MSDIIYHSINISDLILNGEQIDYEDDDFQIILKCLAASSDEVESSANAHKKRRCNPPNQEYPNLPKVPCGKAPSNNRKHERGGIENFPKKLYKILERSDVEGHSSIISWLPHGRSFKIHNEDLFKEHIMTKYFYGTAIKSFKHQLYVYGFRKIGKRFSDAGSYHHQLFIRGRLDLCNEIIRFDDGNLSIFDTQQ